MNRLDKQTLGEAGVIYETDTTTPSVLTGLDVWKITTLKTTTFATLTNAVGAGDDITGIAIPAGVDLYGKFTNVTLTSGAVALYKSDKL
jgi:hypothetical protein